MCALVEAKGIQMMAMDMFGSFFARVVQDKVMETSSLYLALFKDHFDLWYVCFGGQEVPDAGYGDV